MAEARAGGWQRDSEAAEADRCRLNEELQLLKKEVPRTHLYFMHDFNTLRVTHTLYWSVEC